MAALDLHQKRWLVTSKLLVEKFQMLIGGRYVRALPETVCVQLANEGADVVVLEVSWQNVFRECVWVADDKRVALHRPADAALSRLVAHNLKELGEEGRHVGTDCLRAVLHGGSRAST